MLLFAENYILFRVFGCRRINSVEKKHFISLDKKYNEKNAKKSLQKKSAVYVADSVVIFGNITKKHECFLRTITNFAKNVKQT